MEDAHTYVFDFAGVRGQGFFAVFDGHAGKEAADWCAKNFHEVRIRHLMKCGIFTRLTVRAALVGTAGSEPGHAYSRRV